MYKRKPCINCGKETTNKKFCSRSCSTSFNNKNRFIDTKEIDRKVYDKRYRKNHRQQVQDYSKRRRKELRNNFFKMYGNKCVCCGETEIAFLTLDHLVPKKSKYESGSRSYRRALEEYTPDSYQVLCYNCNCGKIDGVCPHKLNKKED